MISSRRINYSDIRECDTVHFRYHGTERSGSVEGLHYSPNGNYVTIEIGEGEYKSFSEQKIFDLEKIVL